MILPPPASPFRVPFSGRFSVRGLSTTPPRSAPHHDERRQRLQVLSEEIGTLQQRLFAEGHHALLLVFQGMDTAGKDGTIRAVLSKVDPAGCRVHSFKAPSAEERAHDFLWRTVALLPPRGCIGVFNRSHYEDVLTVRVHPELLGPAFPPYARLTEAFWEQRLQSIREHERHLAHNGTVILKFWLNLSRREQRERLLARLDEPDKRWKFDENDLAERRLWPEFQAAYAKTLALTSRAWAPWYAIPADSKSYMRLQVAEIVAAALRNMRPRYPALSPERRARLAKQRRRLARD